MMKTSTYSDMTGQSLAFACSKCGACCRHLRVFAGLYADLDDGTGVCRHYDKTTRLCRCYAERPLKCRVVGGDALFQEQLTFSEYLRKTEEGCRYLQSLP